MAPNVRGIVTVKGLDSVPNRSDLNVAVASTRSSKVTGGCRIPDEAGTSGETA